jgi:thioredoxin-related protein
MKRYAWILIAVLAAVTARAGDVNWSHNYDEALKKAKADKKLVMIDIYTDWCGYCKKLDKEVYTNKEVQEKLAKSFICVKLNPERTASTKKLMKEFGVRGFPYIAFLDADGKKLEEIGGYTPAKNFSAVIDKVLKKAGL